jgi:hypothetical protein
MLISLPPFLLQNQKVSIARILALPSWSLGSSVCEREGERKGEIWNWGTPVLCQLGQEKSTVEFPPITSNDSVSAGEPARLLVHR